MAGVQLPNVENSIIEPAKIRNYLLSRSHPTGMYKASFFESLGYTETDWHRLADDLRSIGVQNDARYDGHNGYGRMYTVDGNLVGPTGRRSVVKTVWIVPDNDDRPRLVTAYPGDNE